MYFSQLLPTHGDVAVGELLESLDLGARAPAERPYTIVNFVASVDGRATIGGHSGPLGDEGDRAMFHGLREQVDAVLAGTGTLRTERYGRVLRKPERRERRVQRGLPAEPLATLITRSGEIPHQIPMFDDPEARVVVFSPVQLKLAEHPAQITLDRIDPGEFTLTTALRRLRSEYGIRWLLCEGGPTLFGALLQEGLVDELFLTLAPVLVGGGRGPAITSGPELADPYALRLVWALERHGLLFLRYSVI
jgi:5-amino-6-(5-phosphoribosylamino)uracil reductase